jgi:O-antigen/teichoic acid export membrane protein
MSDKDFDENEFRRKLRAGAKWAASLRLISQAYSWLVNIVIVRFLLPEDYGLNAMLEVPIELLMLFSTLGLDMALVRKQKRSREELSAAFGLLLLINTLIFLVLVFGAPVIANYFKEPRLVALIQVAAIIFLLLPFRAIPDALLDRELAFKIKSQIDLAATLTASTISLVMAILGAGVWALVVALVGGAALRVILFAVLRPWLVMPSFRFVLVKDLLQAGGIMTASAALVVLAGRVVNLIAGPVLGAEVLGYFALAAGFALMPLSKVMPIVQQIMFPAFARLEGHPELAAAYLKRAFEITSMIVFPVSIGLACVSVDFVMTVFGAKWLPAALPLAALSAVIPIRMLITVSTPALNALGYMRYVFIVYLVFLVILVVGAPIALKWSITGIVVLWVAATISVAALVLRVICMKIQVNFHDVVRAVWPATAGCLAMASSLFVLSRLWMAKSDITYLFLEVVLGAMIYFMTIRFGFPERFAAIKLEIIGPRSSNVNR